MNLLDSVNTMDRKTLYSSKKKDMLVLLVGIDGQMLEVIEPTEEEDFRLGARSLVSLLGLNGMDELSALSHDGFSVKIRVQCYDRASAGAQLDAVMRRALKDHGSEVVCTLSGSPAEHLGNLDVSYLPTASKSTLQGMYVEVEHGGEFSRVSLSNIFDRVIQLMVLSKVPKIVTLLLCINQLGLLSRIYRSIIYEVFDIAEQVAGTAVRLTSHAVAFEELCELGATHISKRTMHRRIAQATQHREEFSQHCLERFVNFTHKALVDLVSLRRQGDLTTEVSRLCCRGKQTDVNTDVNTGVNTGVNTNSSMLGIESSGNSSMLGIESCGSSPEALHLDSFVAGCSSNDRLHIRDAVSMFDLDRKLGYLEGVFMPRYFRRLLSSVAHMKLDSSCNSNMALAPVKDLFSEDGKYDAKEQHNKGAKAFHKVMEMERRILNGENLEANLRDILFPNATEQSNGNDDMRRGESRKLRELIPKREDVDEAMATTRSEVLGMVTQVEQHLKCHEREVAKIVADTHKALLSHVEKLIVEMRSTLLHDVAEALSIDSPAGLPGKQPRRSRGSGKTARD